MKEQTTNMWSHKVAGIVQPCGSTRIATDEILSSLLRMNNFDSVSSIKDESLDIDLSACVTITPTAIVNGNSLSSSDFWRVLDESAQIPEKEEISLTSVKSEVNDELPSCFTGTFLRPDPPTILISPIKRHNKSHRHVLDQKRLSPTNNNRSCFSVEQLQDFSISPPPTQPCILIKQENQDNFTVKVENEDGTFEKEYPEQDSIVSLPRFSEFHLPKKTNNNKGVKSSSNISNGKSPMEIGNTVTLSQTEDIKNATIPHNTVIVRASTSKESSKSIKNNKQNQDVNGEYKCTECDKIFEDEANLKKHLKSHKTNGDSRKDIWKKCPDCGKYLKLGSMWMHRKIHSDNRKYECEICGQKFVQKINLTHHTRIHTSEKPFECPECHKRFQERSHLQRHQKYHAQTRSYRCEKCGKMYKTERCLKVHNLVHLERRPFACTVCDKSFISNSKLKQHLNIHTGARPFKCNYCPRDFTNFPNWLKHTRRRHKVDHKTGEQLENLPSYCAKKSTSAASKAAADKPAKNSNASTRVAANAKNSPQVASGSNKDLKKEVKDSKVNLTYITPDTVSIETNFVGGGAASEVLNIEATTVSAKLPVPSIKDKNYESNLPYINIINPFPNISKATSFFNTTATDINDVVLSSKSNKKTLNSLENSFIIEIEDDAAKTSPFKNNHNNNNNTITTTTIISSGGGSSVEPSPSFASEIIQSSQGQRGSIIVKRTHNQPKFQFSNEIQTITKISGEQNIITIGSNSSPFSDTKIKREHKKKNISVNNDFDIPIIQGAPGNLTKSGSASKIIKTTAPNKQVLNNFIDLHCLSMTSAEDLIMEQALEMEECGYYDGSRTTTHN